MTSPCNDATRYCTPGPHVFLTHFFTALRKPHCEFPMRTDVVPVPFSFKPCLDTALIDHRFDSPHAQRDHMILFRRIRDTDSQVNNRTQLSEESISVVLAQFGGLVILIQHKLTSRTKLFIWMELLDRMYILLNLSQRTSYLLLWIQFHFPDWMGIRLHALRYQSHLDMLVIPLCRTATIQCIYRPASLILVMLRQKHDQPR